MADVGAQRTDERDRIALMWLPVVDNLERTLELAAADPGAALDGVRAVRDEAVDLLRALGYPRREEIGVPFDPLVHEAVGVAAGVDAEPGTVVRVLRPGYGTGARMLRPAAVVIADRG
jgi:molecular chaperone GrpE